LKGNVIFQDFMRIIDRHDQGSDRVVASNKAMSCFTGVFNLFPAPLFASVGFGRYGCGEPTR
jgi:hypothetical protein